MQLQKAAQDIAKTGVNRLKNKPTPIRTGAYAEGWTQKTQSSGNGDFSVVVHNKKHYRLTHLLENGHKTSKGGMTRSFPHISPVERDLIDAYEKEVERIIGGGS